MSGDRERMRSIFDRARGLAGAERSAFLDGLAAADQPMRAQVEDMLVALDEAGRFLSEPTHGDLEPQARPTATAPLREGPGTRIGPYKLLQLIGEGGFGCVFMAEQERPVQRKVALKIIKLGMDTRQVVARFEQERQALAMMDHPGIAKVLDAGATDTGRPYFVMELVRGDPITEYCDRNSLSTEERLGLFIAVCNAVQHAHQKGIIHRDIKPSNVLVTVADGKPIPKVIDFGIAKATSAKLTEKTLFTEHRALIGTPEYMSPEQAEMSGVDIDTRSDIYSLGVLLYELLTGVTPFDGKQLRSAAYAEIQRIIREIEPPRPSTRLSSLGETLQQVAAHRRTEPARLGRVIRGDLDWIVMKALEKDRTRRYETASSLGADVQRHLGGEAVIAAPPSRAYRVRKFVRRNRTPVAAGMLVSLALVLGLAGTAAGMIRAEHARDAESRQRKSAEAERDKARAIAAFMNQTLRGLDPEIACGRDTRLLKKMMDDAGERILKGELRAVPEAEVRLRTTIGHTYTKLASFDDAENMLGPALDLAHSLYPGDHADTAAVLHELGLLRNEHGDGFSNLPYLQQAMEIERRINPSDHYELLDYLTDVGWASQYRGDLDTAERLEREGVAMARQLYPGDHYYTAACMVNLANVLMDRGDLAGAESLDREAAAMVRRAVRGDHVYVSSTLMRLGEVLIAAGKYGEAEPILRETLEMVRRLVGADHPWVSIVLVDLGRIHRLKGLPAEGEVHCRQALEISRRAFAANDPHLVIPMIELAMCLKDLGRLPEALELAQQADALAQGMLPAGHKARTKCQKALAEIMNAGAASTQRSP